MNTTLAEVVVAVVMIGLVLGVPTVVLLNRRGRLRPVSKPGDTPGAD